MSSQIASSAFRVAFCSQKMNRGLATVQKLLREEGRILCIDTATNMSAIASHPDIGSGVKSKTLVLHQAQDLYAEVDIETYPKLAVEVLGGIDVVIFIGAGPPIPSSFVDIEEEVYDYENSITRAGKFD